MRIDISNAELHNMVKRKGGLEVRKGLVSIKQPTANNLYVAGFSVESPFTTEVWHYLFEQHTTTSVVTMRVYTEDFVELYSHDLGALDNKPVITHAVANNQIMINSPSFSTPLYGLVGGGIIPAVKTESENPDTTALEIPIGHTCSFGPRTAIAQGNVVYFNDASQTADPRTFVSQNANPLAGTIYDLFQGDDGALYMFTSAGVFYMAQDAIGKGQRIEGFIGMIPGLQTTKPRNAAASNGVVAVLQRGGIAILGGKNQVIDIAPYKGPRYYSIPVEVDDYRLSGEIFATAEGFIVGLRSEEYTGSSFFLDFNLREGYRSYVWCTEQRTNVVGTLRSRENDTLVLLNSNVVMYAGNKDALAAPGDPVSPFDVLGAACIDVDLPEGVEVMVRHVLTSSNNIGKRNYFFLDNNSDVTGDVVPSRPGDAVIGTSDWNDGGSGRRHRSLRRGIARRVTNIPLEVSFTGGMSQIESGVEVVTKGQGRRRGNKR
jgi:hypothetical protein